MPKITQITNWKEEFEKWWNKDPALELANGVGTPENIADWWIEKLSPEIEQAKKDLLTELLNEAPKEMEKTPDYSFAGKKPTLKYGDGFNSANKYWRTLLESKLK